MAIEAVIETVVEEVIEMAVARSVTIVEKYVVNLPETVQDPLKEERMAADRVLTEAVD